MYAFLKLVFFSVAENGGNGLGDEFADGSNAPRMFGLEPPLRAVAKTRKATCR